MDSWTATRSCSQLRQVSVADSPRASSLSCVIASPVTPLEQAALLTPLEVLVALILPPRSAASASRRATRVNLPHSLRRMLRCVVHHLMSDSVPRSASARKVAGEGTRE